jgi:hypothetical protein
MEFFKINFFVLNTFDIPKNQDQFDLPNLYWIPKLHTNPYKQRYIAGSNKCFTKPLSLLLTKLLTAIKEPLQRYCCTAYSRSGVNQMWILKNSVKRLENLKSLDLCKIHSISPHFIHFNVFLHIGGPLLAEIFSYSYEAEFIQKLLHERNKPFVVAFNSTFRYINDALSINNDGFHSYVDFIYPSELEIKDTTQ